MTIVAPPRPPQQETHDLDALIREARQRTRRRRALYAVAILLVSSGLAAALLFSLSGGPHASTSSLVSVNWGKASVKTKGVLIGLVGVPPRLAGHAEDISLFAAQPAAHRLRVLDKGPWQDERVAVSPDGRAIAFLREPNNPLRVDSTSLFVLDRSSGRVTRLARVGAGGDLQWTPDSTRILYVSCVDVSGPCDLRSIGADGSGSRVIVPSVDHFAISPDGRWLAFDQFLLGVNPAGVQRHRAALYVERLDGSGRHVLFARRAYGYGGLSWSKQGWIAVETGRPTGDATEAVTISGRHRSLLRVKACCELGNPLWSPDGSWLASPDGGWWVVRANGRGLHRLPVVGGGGFTRAGFEAWSPNGSRLVLSEAWTPRNAPGTQILLASPTRGTPLTIARFPWRYARAAVSAWLSR